MRIVIRSLGVALVASLLTTTACTTTKDDVNDDFSDLVGLDDKSDAFSYRMKIVGSLDYGQTSDEVAYTKKPRFRAFKFGGSEGDVVDVWVRSEDGDAVAWVLDNKFRVLGFNDDAEETLDSHVQVTLGASTSVTHYIVFRDYAVQSAHFTVTLGGAPVMTACAVDTDCALVERGCCNVGDYTAVRVDQVDAFIAGRGCDASEICPAFPIADRGTQALCNADSHVCQAVAGVDIACGGHTIHPHQCAAGWNCVGDALAWDGTGTCAKFCGGFGNFGCPDGFDCADNPYDDCDVATGGADCGGICLPADCRATDCASGSSCQFCWGSWQCAADGSTC